MPDLRPFAGYQRSMLHLERKYKARLRGVMKDARRRMVEKVSMMGVKNSMLTFSLHEETASLMGSARAIGREVAPEVAKVTVVYVDRQLRAARTVVAGLPRMDDIRDLAYLDEIALLDASMAGDLGAVAVFDGRLTSALRGLMGESEGVAVQRLFSTGLYRGRASAFRHAMNSVQTDAGLALWGAGNLLSNLYYETVGRESGKRFSRQVIAAIDERTTTCCLTAHGQIQRFGKPFVLRGTPRFADQMMHTPFHWNCRSSISLYMPELEEVGVSTNEMVKASRGELISRERTGTRVEIHPAHSTSRRD